MEDADIVTADGLPLVWLLRQQGFKDAERVTGTDLTLGLCRLAEIEKIPVYFYGGSSETINKLKIFMGKRFTSLQATYESPPMLPQKPKVDQDVVSL